MPKLSQLCLMIFLVTVGHAALAVTILECIDADGNSSFRDLCPPGSSKKGEKRLAGLGGPNPQSLEAIAAANPVTLYSAGACDSCDLVRNAISKRGVPFKEKNVEGNIAFQEELKSVSGALTVPTLKIGDTVLEGYSSSAIQTSLDAAGYPMDAPPTTASNNSAGDDDEEANDDNGDAEPSDTSYELDEDETDA